MAAIQLTTEQLRALPPVLSFKKALRILGLCDAKGYGLYRQNEFPVPVHKVGDRFKVPTAPLLRYLGVDTNESDHGLHTQGSSSAGEPLNSCVVKTKRGTVIRPDGRYKFRGELWSGADIITIAQLLGVA